MTITTLILLWALRIASSLWVLFLIYAALFVYGSDIRRTEPVRDSQGKITHYHQRNLTFIERQKYMWLDSRWKGNLLRISIYVSSIVLCILAWLNL